MSVNIKQTGLNFSTNDVPDTAKRAAMAKSDGNTILVYLDGNSSTTAAVGWGDRDNVHRFYIYESNSTARTAFTLKATITPGATPAEKYKYTCCIFPDNSIGIAYKTSTGTIRFIKVTYGTWATSECEIVPAVANHAWVDFDVAVHYRTGYVLAAVMQTANTGQPSPYQVVEICVKDYNGTYTVPTGAFQRYASAAHDTDADNYIKANTGDLSIAINSEDLPAAEVPGGGATADRIRYMVAYSRMDLDVYDRGVLVYSDYLDTDGTDIFLGGGWGQWWDAMDQDIIDPNDANYRSTGVVYTLDVHKPRNTFLFPGEDGGDFVLASINREGVSATHYVAKYRWDATLSAAASGIGNIDRYQRVAYASGGVLGQINSASGRTVTYSYGAVNFIYTATVTSEYKIWNQVARLTDDDQIIFSYLLGSQAYRWNYNDETLLNDYLVGGGGGLNYDKTYHDLLWFHRLAANQWQMWHTAATPPRSPSAMSVPTLNTSTPNVNAQGDIDKQYGQSKYKMKWGFAKDAGFTTSYREFTSADSKFADIYNTGVAGLSIPFGDVVPALSALDQSTWYGRVAQVDEFGNAGPWYNMVGSFTISHPPTATGLAPSGSLTLTYGTGDVAHTWVFSDSYGGDSQTAYQLIAERTDTSAVVLDTGKVSSTAALHVANYAAGLKDIPIRWKVRLWDIDDVVGPYSAYSTFMLADPLTIVMISPVNGGVVGSAIPQVSWEPDGAASRTVVQARATWTQGATVIFDSGVYSTSVAEGATHSYNSGVVALENSQLYTITVWTKDNLGIESSTVINVSTAWTPPDGVDDLTVDMTHFGTEDEGYILLSWPDDTIDADFLSWIVYQKVDQINPNTLVVTEEGVWSEVGRVYGTATTYEFLDYSAPSGVKVSYRVHQLVDRFGDQIQSETTDEESTYPNSDGYWLLSPSSVSEAAMAFRLSDVTDDSYTEEFEEATFNIIGRGRVVERGSRLGVSGTLTAKLRDGGGTTARHKKRKVEQIKSENRSIFLRTPFGDIYPVALSNIQVSRIAGVGLSEFCDLSIPYLEVVSD